MLQISETRMKRDYRECANNCEIAKRWNCTPQAVRYRLGQLGLPSKSKRGARQPEIYHRTLSDREQYLFSTLWHWIDKATSVGVSHEKCVDGAIMCARYEISGRRYRQKGVMP